jgi:uncharacterized protein
VQRHPLDGPYYWDRSAHWDKIKTPFLSAGNWGGHGLHLRGNVEGFVGAASEQKWLETYGKRTGRTSTRSTAWRCRRSF